MKLSGARSLVSHVAVERVCSRVLQQLYMWLVRVEEIQCRAFPVIKDFFKVDKRGGKQH